MSKPIKYIKGEKGNIIYPYTTMDAIFIDEEDNSQNFKDIMPNIIKCSDIDVQKNQITQIYTKTPKKLSNIFLNNSNYILLPKKTSKIKNYNSEYLDCEMIASNNGWGIIPIYNDKNGKVSTFTITFKPPKTAQTNFKITLGNIDLLSQRTDILDTFFGEDDENKEFLFTIDKDTTGEGDNESIFKSSGWLKLTIIINRSPLLQTQTPFYKYSLQNKDTGEWLIPMPEGSQELGEKDANFGILFSSSSSEKFQIKEISLKEEFAIENKFTIFLKENNDDDDEIIIYNNEEYYHFRPKSEEENE